MQKNFVPTSKIGTPFQSPSWRWQVVSYPERFNLDWLCSRKEIDAGHLHRLIAKGIRPIAVYSPPIYLKRLINELPNHLSNIVIKIWNKYYFATHRHKLTFSSDVIRHVPLSWKMNEIDSLNDEGLKRLLYHSFNYKYDKYIEEAIKFYKDIENVELKRWINYSIYNNESDTKLAVRWKKTLGFIKALRMLFYDYSHWPKERFVHFALLRQLSVNGEIGKPEFAVFKRIYDLGDVGLRSIIDSASLTKTEHKEVDWYVYTAQKMNVLDLSYSITSHKDAVEFNRIAGDFANVGLKRMEIEQRAELLRLTANKLAKEMGLSEENNTFAEDTVLLQEMENWKRFNHVPQFASFIDVKTERVKPEVNKLVENSNNSA